MNYLSYLCNLDNCIAFEGKDIIDTNGMLCSGITGSPSCRKGSSPAEQR